MAQSAQGPTWRIAHATQCCSSLHEDMHLRRASQALPCCPGCWQSCAPWIGCVPLTLSILLCLPVQGEPSSRWLAWQPTTSQQSRYRQHGCMPAGQAQGPHQDSRAGGGCPHHRVPAPARPSRTGAFQGCLASCVLTMGVLHGAAADPSAQASAHGQVAKVLDRA